MPNQLTVVAVTYDHKRKLNIFLDSMLEQTWKDWECIIVHDGSSGESSEDTKQRIAPYLLEFPDKFRYLATPERANQFGHNCRDLGLQNTNTKWVHITNVDNQLVYDWLRHVMSETIQQDLDLMYWSCVHSYFGFNAPIPELRPGHIDFCNYLMKTELAKQMGFPWRHREADGAQIAQFMLDFPEAHIKRFDYGIFTVHN